MGAVRGLVGIVSMVATLVIGAIAGLRYGRGRVTAMVEFLPCGVASGILIVALGVYLQLRIVTTSVIRLTDEGICFAPDTPSARFFTWANVDAPERRGLDGRFGLF